jgi:two-component system response regulator DevR
MSKVVKILIADDHAVVRAGLKTLIERTPHFQVVAEAGTGNEAIEKARETRPDVAVLDIRMPGKSGIDACREIIQMLPDCKVIMLTSYAEDELLVATIQAGAVGYVLKRVGDNDLIYAIERASQGEGVLDPAMTATVFAAVRKAGEMQKQAAFADLTRQEMAVLSRISQGMTNRQIAAELFLGEGTVRNYVSSILSKLGVANRAEAAAYAVHHHIQEIVPPEQEDQA